MRISVTTLESFRLWSQPEQDWMSEDELLATIRGEFKPTQAVLLGQAFGAVLETPGRYQVDGGYRVLPRGGRSPYFFSDAVMTPAMAIMDYQHGVFEAKATKQYGDCTVVAKADQLVGARLIEHKTTLGSFDFDKYAHSYQWRYMVDIFQPVSVTYHIFLLAEERDGSTALRGIETFNFFPYAELHADCWNLLRGFTSYVTAKGLDTLLRARQRTAEAVA